MRIKIVYVGKDATKSIVKGLLLSSLFIDSKRCRKAKEPARMIPNPRCSKVSLFTYDYAIFVEYCRNNCTSRLKLADFPTILDSKLKSSDKMQADSNSTRQSG